MSSWVSHLPPEVVFAEVIGQGMNAEELSHNPRLSLRAGPEPQAHPPRSNPTAAMPPSAASASSISSDPSKSRGDPPGSPPGRTVYVSFSNRCFPTRAVAIWWSLDDRGHAALVRLYFERSGFRNIAEEVVRDGSASDPLLAGVGHR